ncbi:hypothetical protein BCR44DRAFT_1456640 [Catenaria anguillulae PL171]|uniref:Uncharacterized protein n=1 Tax=Catenaria anguillulae PL171 TaxID=765915 RepID=A0A1Y2GIN4_9FUNG|nr:hypothetical protein BCR44DRAFT_1456640 [Catenaria anguillulae PL171]
MLANSRSTLPANPRTHSFAKMLSPPFAELAAGSNRKSSSNARSRLSWPCIGPAAKHNLIPNVPRMGPSDGARRRTCTQSSTKMTDWCTDIRLPYYANWTLFPTICRLHGQIRSDGCIQFGAMAAVVSCQRHWRCFSLTIWQTECVCVASTVLVPRRARRHVFVRL